MLCLHNCLLYKDLHVLEGTIMAMTVWKFNLQLPIQSMPITTDIVRSNLDQGEVYNII
jgi:hypothetical protein